MLTRKQLEAQWHKPKLICATHFNWWGHSEEWDGYKWLKKPWDAHHTTGEEDPANEDE